MSSIKFGTGAASITIHGDQERALMDMLERVTEGASREMARAAARVYDDARAQWPVNLRTRRIAPVRSRDRFSTGLRVASDSDGAYLGAYVHNDAGYVFMIKSKQVGAGDVPRHAWTELVRKPHDAQVDRLTHELRDVLEREGGR